MALLDGLLHCYTPSLGPTGYRLIDRGPRRINGTTTTVTPSNWRATGAARNSRWSLSVSGTQSFADCGTVPAVSRRSLSVWFRTAENLNGSGVLLRTLCQGGVSAVGQSFTVGIGSGNTVAQAVGATYLFVSQNGGAASVAGYNDDWWHHVIVRHIDSTWDMVIDGRRVSLSHVNMGTTPAAGPMTIGTLTDGTQGWNGWIGEYAFWDRWLTESESNEIFRRGDGAIGRALTGQSGRRSQVSMAIAAGGATPWRYARQRSRIIGGGIS
jgi:hypothetical protein